MCISKRQTSATAIIGHSKLQQLISNVYIFFNINRLVPYYYRHRSVGVRMEMLHSRYLRQGQPFFFFVHNGSLKREREKKDDQSKRLTSDDNHET